MVPRTFCDIKCNYICVKYQSSNYLLLPSVSEKIHATYTCIMHIWDGPLIKYVISNLMVRYIGFKGYLLGEMEYISLVHIALLVHKFIIHKYVFMSE